MHLRDGLLPLRLLGGEDLLTPIPLEFGDWGLPIWWVLTSLITLVIRAHLESKWEVLNLPMNRA